MQSRLKSIDVLRAVAACGVVLFHSNRQFYLGAAGVDLFFVISGFVIAHVATQCPHAGFLLDRASRIFPLYWLALIPWAISAWQAGALDASRLLNNALLFPRMFVPTEAMLVISWTLVFEILFYFGAAVSLRFNSAKPILAIFACFMLAGALAESRFLAWVGNPMLLEFLLGVFIYRARKVAGAGLPVLLAGIGLLLSSPSISRDVMDFSSALNRALVWGVPAALIVYGLVSIEDRLTSPWVDRLCWLGVASYSIYLFHPLAVSLVPGPWWAKFILGICTGAAAWILFESKLERLRRSWRRTARAGAGKGTGDPLSDTRAAPLAAD